MWFDSWSQVVRVGGSTLIAYVALVVILRSSGKRTLAKLNAFDFVVTVALGSVLATIILSDEVSIVDGVAALTVLVLLQFAVAWLSARNDRVQQVVKASPVQIVAEGELLVRTIREQRLTPAEVMQAIRRSGVGGLELVGAVVIETDGTLSVIPHSQLGSRSAVADVRRP